MMCLIPENDPNRYINEIIKSILKSLFGSNNNKGGK